MEIAYIDAAAFLITYILFGFAGYKYSQRLKQSGTIRNWIIYIAALIVAEMIEPRLRLISIFNFAIYFSRALQGFFIGILIRFVVRFVKEKRALKNNNTVI